MVMTDPAREKEVANGDELVARIDSGERSLNGGLNDPKSEEENKLTFAFFMTMVGFSLAFTVAEVLPLILITCFTIIAFDLNALEDVIWILVAPYIATGAIAPFVGTLSDLIGRKGITLFSLACTVVAMIICATAPTIGAFLTGQVVAGVGIGIQLLNTIAAATELVPVSKRGATVGYLAIGFLPFAPASLYGQLLAETSWRYVFLFVGLLAALSFVVLAIWYKPPPRPAAVLPRRELLKRIDYVGGAVSTLGVILFLIGLNWGGQTYSWGSVQVICMLVFGIVSLILFGLWEVFGAKYPMFPARLIQNTRHFIAMSILALTSGINFIPLTVFWTIQCYTVYKGSFRQAGVWLLPLGFCIAGGAILSAIAISLLKKQIHWVLFAFCIIQTVGIATMSVADPNNINTVWAPMVLGLLGVGAVLLPSQIIFSVISPDDLIGTSVALSLVIRMIGQVVGKTMFYNIFRNEVSKHAIDSGFAVSAISVGFKSVDRITLLVTTMTAGPLNRYVHIFPEINTPAKMQIIIDAGSKLYAPAFKLIYYISIPFGCIACLSCLLLIGVQRFVDDHVAVHLV